MKLDDFPSPGELSNGFQLRREAYKAVNRAEINHELQGGKAATGDKLREFFLACAAACPQSVKPAVKAIPKPAAPAAKETA